jgi:hypothetical protein
VVARRWTGLGARHGRLRACCAQVRADGRGKAAISRRRWLLLPAEDGAVTLTGPVDLPAGPPAGGSLTSRAHGRPRSCAAWPGDGAGLAIAAFSVAHHITGSSAWVAALVMMALADVLTRLVVIYLRRAARPRPRRSVG